MANNTEFGLKLERDVNRLLSESGLKANARVNENSANLKYEIVNDEERLEVDMSDSEAELAKSIREWIEKLKTRSR